MPRNTRKRIVGRQEDIERSEREAEYAELETALHCAWQSGRLEIDLIGTSNDQEGVTEA